MKTLTKTIVMLILAGGNVFAAEKKACTDPYRPHQQLSYAQLRAIAITCESKPIAQLYYNRAYHKNMIEKAQQLYRLDSALSSKDKKSLISHSLYMVMLEEFAKIWIPQAAVRTRLLNESYLRHDEILELRLKGQNKIADKIEQQALKQ